MITINNTITIAITTMAIIIMAIITISPRLNQHTSVPTSVGGRQRNQQENLSWRSALPKIQFSTFPAESKAAIVNTMTVRHREILLWRQCQSYGSDYDIDRCHDFSHHTQSTTCYQQPATCLILVPGACISARLWIEHAAAYS
jgi:hypothetical protein